MNNFTLLPRLYRLSTCVFSFSVILYLTGSQNLFSQKANCDSLLVDIQVVTKKFTRQDLELSFSQNDSILELGKSMACPKVEMEGYLNLARYYKEKADSVNLFKNVNLSSEIAKELNDNRRLKDLGALGMLYYIDRANFEEARTSYENSLAILCDGSDILCHKAHIKLYFNYAVNLEQRGKNQEALAVLNKGNRYMSEDGTFYDSTFHTVILNSIGNIYREIGSYDAARQQYLQAAKVVPVQHKSRFLINNNIGSSYLDVGKLDSARLYFQKTINQTDEERYLVVPHQALGRIAGDKRDFVAAEKYYRQAVAIAEVTKREKYIIESKNFLSKTLYKNGKYSESLRVLRSLQPYFDDISETKNALVHKKYIMLCELALRDSAMQHKVETYLTLQDTLQELTHKEALQTQIESFQSRILKDSLSIVKLGMANQSITMKNQRYGLITSLLGLLLGGFFFREISRKYKASQAVNETLIFEKQELEKLNQNLEQKIAAAAAIRPQIGKLELKSSGKTHLVDFADIIYIQTEDNGTRTYTNEKSIWSDTKLKDISPILPPRDFAQIFRSTIVNANCISSISANTLNVSNGDELKIGRTYKQGIKDMLG